MTPLEKQLLAALKTILDSVDYTKGACRPNEMVGAVLDERVIQLARDAIRFGESYAGARERS